MPLRFVQLTWRVCEGWQQQKRGNTEEQANFITWSKHNCHHRPMMMMVRSSYSFFRFHSWIEISIISTITVCRIVTFESTHSNAGQIFYHGGRIGLIWVVGTEYVAYGLVWLHMSHIEISPWINGCVL